MLLRTTLVTIGSLLIFGCGHGENPAARRQESQSPATSATDSWKRTETRDPHRAIGRNTSPRAPSTKVIPASRDQSQSARYRRRADSDTDVTSASLVKNDTLADATHSFVIPGTPSTAGQHDGDFTTRKVRFGGISLVAPESWTRERPPVKFMVALFNLPGSWGDAQLTVTLAVNNDKRALSRLRDQIQQEEESKESSVEHLDISGHEIVLVDSVDDYSDDDGLPAPAGGKRYRVLNAMVFLGESVYFVNCSGPQKTVNERVGEFRDFLESLETTR